jgi:hypothetical protein
MAFLPYDIPLRYNSSAPPYKRSAMHCDAWNNTRISASKGRASVSASFHISGHPLPALAFVMSFLFFSK